MSPVELSATSACPRWRSTATRAPERTTVAVTSDPSAPSISAFAAVCAWSRIVHDVPGWPSTAPTIVTGMPSIPVRAANSRQPPAAEVEPVLMPMSPSVPRRRSVLVTRPATGTRADLC